MKKQILIILTLLITTLTSAQVKENHSEDYYKNLFTSRIDSINKVYLKLNAITKGSNSQPSDLEARDAVENKIHEIVKDFIIEFPDCKQSAMLLNHGKEKWGKETTKELFGLMNKETQELAVSKLVALYLKLPDNPKIGELYVDFEQENVDGKKIKISDIKGKYTLIDFWASWCGPCRAETPEVIRQFEKYKSRGFQVIGVSLDTKKELWLNAVKKDKTPWENISDLNGLNNIAALIYDIKSIPNNILIDENGIVVDRNIPVVLLDMKLDKLFKK